MSLAMQADIKRINESIELISQDLTTLAKRLAEIEKAQVPKAPKGKK